MSNKQGEITMDNEYTIKDALADIEYLSDAAYDETDLETKNVLLESISNAADSIREMLGFSLEEIEKRGEELAEEETKRSLELIAEGKVYEITYRDENGNKVTKRLQ